MKINEETRFPHPVLSEDTGDYRSGEFAIELTAVEVPGRAEVSLDYCVVLSEPSVRKLVSEDDAGVGVYVMCRDTYYSRLVPLGLADSRFTFEPGALVGRVTVRPLIWARKHIAGFSVANCHPEFGEEFVDFDAGDVLALGDEAVLSVGREKLTQIESIFALAKSVALPDDTLSVDLDCDKIRILAAPNIYDTVNTLRGLGAGRPIILNGVYLPAVMQVLDSLSAGASSYESRRWYRVFSAKCDHFSISTDSPELWRDSQKLLAAPFGEINRNREIIGG